MRIHVCLTMHACRQTWYLHPILLLAQVEGIHLVLFGGIALFYVLNGAHILEKQHVMKALVPVTIIPQSYQSQS